MSLRWSLENAVLALLAGFLCILLSGAALAGRGGRLVAFVLGVSGVGGVLMFIAFIATH